MMKTKIKHVYDESGGRYQVYLKRKWYIGWVWAKSFYYGNDLDLSRGEALRESIKYGYYLCDDVVNYVEETVEVRACD